MRPIRRGGASTHIGAKALLRRVATVAIREQNIIDIEPVVLDGAAA